MLYYNLLCASTPVCNYYVLKIMYENYCASITLLQLLLINNQQSPDVYSNLNIITRVSSLSLYQKRVISYRYLKL